ncbi:MAG TPA: TIGR03617 family F420-dependent LLM class oxidoreductase [Anaerolineae bacterium]|nr:TIGR03617 family F420-dependent LLM class oxidoreductase [Anaerolineae bacterium]
MKFDTSIGFGVDLKDVPVIARAAEAIGFDALWSSETQHDPFLPLALIAEHTQRIHLGTAVAIAFARSPIVLAHTAWDLAGQSGGRFILGLGTQVKPHIERRFGMPWGPPVARLREFVRVMRAVWDNWQNGTRLNFRGEHYKVTLMTPFFSPAPIDPLHANIPIYIAGVGAPLSRLAGEVADGFVVHPLNTPKYLAEVVRPAIEEGARRSGRSASDVVISGSVFVAFDAAEREAARAQISFYASTPSYRPVLDLHGWGAIGEQLSALASRGRWDEMPGVVSDGMLDAICVAGTWDEVADQVKARYGGLADRIGFYRPFVPGVDEERWRAVADRLREP